jgi:lysozyme
MAARISPPRAVGVSVVSASMVVFVGNWEGTRYTPYQDIAGVWTVCTGNTHDVVRDREYTAEECGDLLAKDLEDHGRGAFSCVKVPLNNNEQVAIVSLAFNIGINAFCRSTLVRMLNNGNRKEAALQFEKWAYADGHYSRGLARRRKAEKQLFLTPDKGTG